jgi:S-adenosylmethionine synthetase
LDLLRPIYKQTARHGHFGRKPGPDGSFSWEKTDKAETLAKAAGISKREASAPRAAAQVART